ncbi:hypothetical protein PIB30_058763 [Stylosanthes scabra]|uniref:RNase H type-1 domain-containing protein n=1 Tax=Stylosanthes scabra TaxID=79078 RepID=A0ABU6QLU4_9FABA|nr:hypothetical protein [Stylosanthes scabra]
MHNDDIVGFGCAIRNNNGDWQRGCAGTIQVSSVLEGKLFAIYKSLLLAWEADFKEVYCETDCHEAYVLLKDFNIPLCSQKSVLISRIQNIILWPWRVELNLIQRTANRVVDAMAKHTITHRVHYAKWLSPWKDLRELINLDVATS